MPAPAWLTARPIAHRGWHDPFGAVENTLAAARAAVARSFAVECDVQLSRDGEAMVFHDDTLDRLTLASGPVGARSVAELRAIAYRRAEEPMPTLPDLLTCLGGAVPLICEIKSEFRGDMRLAERTAALARAYAGPMAIKSFDPEVIAHLRAAGAPCPLGIVAEASYDDPYFADMSAEARQSAAAFLHYPRTRPDFLSFSVADLPHPTPALLRAAAGAPVMVWTVRTAEDKRRARLWADQIVFEGEPE